MKTLLLGCLTVSIAGLSTSTADAQFRPFQNMRGRAGTQNAVPVAANPYIAPSFAPADGQRIRVISGDGTFLNRYYDNAGRNYTVNGQGVGGYKAYGGEQVMQGEQWLNQARRRQNWGPADAGTTRRIGDGFQPILPSDRQPLAGDGRLLKFVGTAAMIAGPVLSGISAGVSSGGGYGGGGYNIRPVSPISSNPYDALRLR